MKNIIIKTNNEQLSDAEIEQFKNFDQLLDQYQQATPKTKGRLSTPKIVIIVTIAGLSAITLSLLLLNTGDNKPTNAPNNQPVQQTAFIQPPIPQADIPMQNFAVDNSRDTNLRLPSGTEITIPARALLLDGKPANCEKVQVMVREMKTVDEVFLSGIPMQYDSAGKQYTFETAGMMQIEARCNNRPLSIDPKRPLSVAMTSPTDANQFNLYQLDTNKRAWMFKGKDRIVKNTSTTSSNQKNKKLTQTITSLVVSERVLTQQEELQIEQMFADQKENTGTWCIKLDVLSEEFPELRPFSNQLFEIDSLFKKLKKSDPTKEWEDIQLAQSAFPERYWIKFKSNTDSCRYLVKPVFPNAIYAKAKEDFEKSFKKYQKQLAIQLKTTDSLEKIYAAKRQQQQNAQATSNISGFSNLNEEYDDDTDAHSIITRHFSINNFGIWNCDHPFPTEQYSRYVHFMYNKLTYRDFPRYVVNTALRAIVPLYPNEPLRYNKDANNIAWIVVKNEIYYSTASNFAAEIKTNTLHLQKASKPILSAADFKEVYNNEIMR